MANQNSQSYSPSGEEEETLICSERINTYEEADDQIMMCDESIMIDLGVSKSKSEDVFFSTEWTGSPYKSKKSVIERPNDSPDKPVH